MTVIWGTTPYDGYMGSPSHLPAAVRLAMQRHNVDDIEPFVKCDHRIPQFPYPPLVARIRGCGLHHGVATLIAAMEA